jgi:predicted RNase H-like HicB family nuclease
MKRQYLVQYFKMKNNFSGHAPDILGCVSVGDTLEEMRAMMKEALESHFVVTVEDGISIPYPTTTTLDFSRASEDFDPDVEYVVVEWLEVEVPEVQERAADVAAD